MASAVVDLGKSICRHYWLTIQLARMDISQRHAGQIIGAKWSIIQPIFVMLIYTIVFTWIFPARMGTQQSSSFDLSIFVLSALVPWITIIECMARSARAITNEKTLVKQVVFPVETLPIKTVLSVFLSHIIASAFLILLVLWFHGGMTFMQFTLIIALLIIQFLTMVGISLLFASTGVIIRDLPEVIQAFGVIGLFLAPILYSVEKMTELWPPSVYFSYANPFTHLVLIHRDAYYYGEIQHPISWGLAILFGIIVLLAGSFLFSKLREHFAELL